MNPADEAQPGQPSVVRLSVTLTGDRAKRVRKIAGERLIGTTKLVEHAVDQLLDRLPPVDQVLPPQ